MYWYKRISSSKVYYKVAIASAIAALFVSCGPSTPASTANSESYVDIPAYFKAEIERMKQSNPTVEKTVKKDSISETKTLQIANWDNELSSFVSIDLNKPAYRGIFQKDSVDNKVTLTTNDPKIDISHVEIDYQDGKPVAFLIKRSSKSSLYATHETLYYKQNEQYSLEKKQDIKVLGEKYYFISALLK